MPNRPLPKGVKRHSLSSKKVFQGERFSIYQWEQKLFDGSSETFEIAKRNDTVVIIPFIDNHIVAVQEFQPHWEKPGLVLVAGMVNDDEELEAAARRELEEETGLVCKDFYLVDVEYPTPGVEWGVYTFIASNLIETKDKNLDPGEQNDVVRIPFDEFTNKVINEEFLYRPTFAERYVLRNKADNLLAILQNPEKHTWKV